MVTLDIEDNVIRAITVQGNSVKSAVEEPIEPGLVKDGIVLNPKVVGKIIRDMFSKNGIREKNVIASVSGINSIYRVSKLPKFSGDVMVDAVNREMARVIPVPLNELYTSYQMIPSGESEVMVSILGIPKETIDFSLSAMREAGLSVKVLDLRPLAIARVADELNAIIINIQPTCFDIVIVINGMPELIRSLPFSEDSASLEERMAEFGEELERTISFYDSSNPNRQIPEDISVFISGPLKELVKRNIKYRVKPLPDLLLYPEGFVIDSYIANVGLALKQGKIKNFPIIINLNVLPGAYLPKTVSLVQIFSWLFIIFAIAILIFNGINTGQVLARNALLQDQIKNLTAQVESRGASVPEVEKLQTQLQSIEKERDDLQVLIGTLAKERDEINNDLGVITSSVSGKIILTSIVYDGTWTVRGSAPDVMSILSYVFVLQSNSRFRLVELSSINEFTFFQWDFIVTISNQLQNSTGQ
jgi:type IV pilus assembly protein PilM